MDLKAFDAGTRFVIGKNLKSCARFALAFSTMTLGSLPMPCERYTVELLARLGISSFISQRWTFDRAVNHRRDPATARLDSSGITPKGASIIHGRINLYTNGRAVPSIHAGIGALDRPG
jgi:hypothetical protein